MLEVKQKFTRRNFIVSFGTALSGLMVLGTLKKTFGLTSSGSDKSAKSIFYIGDHRLYARAQELFGETKKFVYLSAENAKDTEGVTIYIDRSAPLTGAELNQLLHKGNSLYSEISIDQEFISTEGAKAFQFVNPLDLSKIIEDAGLKNNLDSVSEITITNTKASNLPAIGRITGLIEMLSAALCQQPKMLNTSVLSFGDEEPINLSIFADYGNIPVYLESTTSMKDFGFTIEFISPETTITISSDGQVLANNKAVHSFDSPEGLKLAIKGHKTDNGKANKLHRNIRQSCESGIPVTDLVMA